MILLLLFLVSVLMAATNLPDFSAYVADPFQKICISLSPDHSIFKDLYSATICGVNPGHTSLMWDFRNTGLYHLIVVSGAHLSFLATLVTATFGSRRWLVIAFLSIYSLASGLNPPVCRALIGFVLNHSQKRHHWGWSPSNVVLASGLVCLIFFPSWWRSLSFQMSWLASLAVALPGSLFRKTLYCYLLLLLPMSVFQWNHPVTVIFNLILAPVLGFIVLPFSLLPFVAPFMTPASDFVWHVVISIVQVCSRFVTSLSPVTQFPLVAVWIFVLSLHVVLHSYGVRIRRYEWKMKCS